jgi:AcrR family transcriptional regulator
MLSVRKLTQPVRSRLSRDERRTRILEAAAEVFAERGYDAASLDEIAEGAGISKPVIYDHFESKRELHITLIDSQSELLLSSIASRVAAGETPEDRLREGFDAFFEFVETHPFAWRMFFRDPSSDPEIAEGHQQSHERTAAGIAALIAAESIIERAWAVEALAELMMKALAGLAAWWYEHPEITRADLVALTMDSLWVGLERVQKGERWAPEPGGDRGRASA